MSFATHENKYLKHCLNCNNEVSDLNPEHVYCTQCGFPIRNECTGTSKFHNGNFNDPVEHDIDDEEYVLEPNVVFCPKCSSISLFAEKGLIENKYPKVEIVHQSSYKPNGNDDDPFY